jgi:hypothetical protein
MLPKREHRTGGIGAELVGHQDLGVIGIVVLLAVVVFGLKLPPFAIGVAVLWVLFSLGKKFNR